MRFVLDASVAVKWYLFEDHSEDARALLNAATEFSVPDFFYAEVANVFWKRLRRNEITRGDAASYYRLLEEVPLAVHDSKALAADALALAADNTATVYDHLYLSLALRDGRPLVTADRVFYEMVVEGPHAPSIVWVRDARVIASRQRH
jgi:predicted nucleic acid-binding protein